MQINDVACCLIIHINLSFHQVLAHVRTDEEKPAAAVLSLRGLSIALYEVLQSTIKS